MASAATHDVDHHTIIRAETHGQLEHVDQIRMAGNRELGPGGAEFAEFEREIEPRRAPAGELGKTRRIEITAEDEGLRHVPNAQIIADDARLMRNCAPI